MRIQDLLQSKRAELVNLWFERVIDTYPAETAKFIRKEKDPFANPVGSSTLTGLEGVLEKLSYPLDRTAVEEMLDPIVRIRAVQSFKPSDAVSFVFDLKYLIKKTAAGTDIEDMDLLDRLLDEVALIAFDKYMDCKIQLFEFRANQTRKRTLRLLEKAGLTKEVEEVGAEIIPHNVYKNGGFDQRS